MIDPTTGWLEIEEAPGTDCADAAASLAEQQWSTRCPWPNETVMDRGEEFLAEFKAMLQDDCDFSLNHSAKRNPQSNATLEWVHQTTGNVLHAFEVHNDAATDEGDPWSGILSTTAFAVRATAHSVSRATPMQMVFGLDAMCSTCAI